MGIISRIRARISARKSSGSSSSSSSSSTTISGGGGMTVGSPIKTSSGMSVSATSGSSGGGGSSSGGMSRVNPVTGQGEYVTETGQVLPANELSRKIITQESLRKINSSLGISGGGGSSSGGMSRVNPVTGQGEYVTETGQVLPANELSRKIIAQESLRKINSSLGISGSKDELITRKDSAIVKDKSGNKYTVRKDLQEDFAKQMGARIRERKSAKDYLDALASVPFYNTTLGGIGEDLTKKETYKPVKKVVNAFGDVKFYNSTIKEEVKRGVKFIGDIPFYQSTIKETVKDLPKNILETPLAIPEFYYEDGKRKVRPSTIGKQSNILFVEYPQMIGKLSAEGYRDMGIKEEKIVYDAFGNKVKKKTIGGYFIKGIEKLPEFSLYAVPIAGELKFGYEGLDLGVKSRPEEIKKEAEKIASERYSQYLKEDVPEGYERLSKIDFIKQVSPQIQSQLKSGYSKEALLLGGMVLGAGALRGFSRFTPKKNLLGLTTKQYKEASEIVGKEIKALEKEPILFFSIQQKGTGEVLLKGRQISDKLKRNVLLEGYLKKTEKGLELLPTSKVVSTIEGNIGVGKKIFRYEGLQLGEAGSKGFSFPRGKIGNIPISYQVNIGGSRPLIQTSVIGKLKYFSGKYDKLLLKKLKKGVKVGGQEVVEVSDSYLAKIGKNAYVTLEGESGAGLTLIKDAPKKDLGLKIVKGSGRKTPLSKTFSQEEVLTKISPPKIEKPKNLVPEVKEVKQDFPRMVSGQGLKTIPYSGSGMYERSSEEGVKISIKSPVKIDSITKPSLGTLNIERLKSSESSGTRFRKKDVISDKGLLDLKPKEALKEKIMQREKLVPKTKLTSKQVLDLLTKQKLKQTQKPRIKERPIITKIPVVPKLSKGITSEVKEPNKKLLKDFKVFVTKRGKDVKLGEFGTIEEAKESLVGELKGTLRAGGFIKKGGKKVRVDLGYGFRTSKRDPFKVVQRKSFRFGTKKETSEAQFFRKKKGGGNFF